MPQKKSAGGKQQAVKQPAEPAMAIPVDGDTVAFLVSIVDKKARNLEKRKNKLIALKESEDAAGLDKDQREAITKIKDVTLQLEVVRDLQKQFSLAEAEIARARKRQQKAEKLQAKEAEHVTRQKAVAYTLRVTDLLVNVGDEDKENFKEGNDGATKLSEEDLTQIDEFYKLVAPQRSGNLNFESEVAVASEHMLSLMDASPKEVAGTTYKDLREIVQKMDSCGYFDRAPPSIPDEDSEEDGEDYKSADDQSQVRDPPEQEEEEAAAADNYAEDVDIPPEVPPSVDPEGPSKQLIMPPEAGPVDHTPVDSSVLSSPPIMAQTSGIMKNVNSGSWMSGGEHLGISLPSFHCMPNAPSPTFPALQGTSPVLLSHDGGSFSFMHDSKLDRSQSSNSSMAPPPVHQTMTTAATPPGHQSPLLPSQTQGLQSHHAPISAFQYDTRGSENVGAIETAAEMETMNNQAALKAQSTTDVATGQPSIPQQYQPRGPSLDTAAAMPGTMMSSSGGELINQDLGGIRGGGSNEVGMPLYSSVMPLAADPPQTSYNRPQQQQQQQQHQSQQGQPRQGQQNAYFKGPPQQQRRDGRGFNQGGGGGGRRGGGSGGGGWGRSNYTAGKNGRGGMQGGMDGQSYSSSRGFGGGGFAQQQPRSGRQNYRTSNGGQSSSGPQRS